MERRRSCNIRSIAGIATIGLAITLVAGCSRSNNLLLGRVKANLGTHTVVVTDCYRTSVPAPEPMPSGGFHYAPCRDAEIWIRGEELTVNGRQYGHLDPGDGVSVDHGVVSVDKRKKDGV